MTWRVHATLVLAVALGIAAPRAAPSGPLASRAQGDSPRVHWLVFVDELHVDFRGTGRIRDLLRAFSATLVRETDVVSVVTSGPAALDVRARPGAATLIEAAKRITGNGLKDEDTLRPPAGRIDEVVYRTRTALAAAIALVESAGPAPSGERRVLLYLSRGYVLDRPRGRDVIGEAALDALDVATARAGAVVVAVEPERVPEAAGTGPAAAAREPQGRGATLARLAAPSGGFHWADTSATRVDLLGAVAGLVGR